MGVGQGQDRSVEPAEGSVGSGESKLQIPFDPNRWTRRSRCRSKSPEATMDDDALATAIVVAVMIATYALMLLLV
jgi:hypothetical protein